ncbi:small multi-drug export protein [Methanofollis fontis]|uniref:Small multi-drug export protein n=1 Tax=Methanofollis fontis TaxID=2052832 RepID=A0A483CR82_9EURY|nr:small multi-drug export protein [Methanofollis fontis]TAJ45613.1 hypothetical protein CUJ86_02505 [Methanofollis fontis]
MIGVLGFWKLPVFRDPTVSRLLRLVIPMGIALVFFLALYLSRPYPEFLVLLGLITAYLLPPAGKESVIPIGIGLGEPWWLIGASTLVMDLCCSLFIALNLDLALRIPIIGGVIGRFMEGGRGYLDARPWLERFSYAGLILFVIIPFQGSGGVNATILGRILGFGIGGAVGCVLVGSAVSSFGIALGAGALLHLFRHDPVWCAAVVAAAALLLGVAWCVWRRIAPSP